MSSATPERTAAELTCAVVIDDGAPWQADHFPGRPIVPGVVLMAALEQALRAAEPALGACLEWRQVRFRSAVSAPIRMTARGRWQSGVLTVTMTVAVSDTLVLQARMRFGSPQ